jgi:hypothetical protein
VEVGGAPQVAETLGIGEGTVKTHLKRLYAKTGARRQADLVKLFAGYVRSRADRSGSANAGNPIPVTFEGGSPDRETRRPWTWL